MAGGPQDGQRFVRTFEAPRAAPPPMRASDGKACCPVAMRMLARTAVCVVVHPQARDEEIERAIDTMIDAAEHEAISGK